MRNRRLRAEDVPVALNILGHVLPVVLKHNLKQDGEYCDGCFNHNNNTIELCTKVGLDNVKKVLFHEALHAAIHFSGQHTYLDGTPNLEEALVLLIEQTFAHAIDLNKLTIPDTSSK